MDSLTLCAVPASDFEAVLDVRLLFRTAAAILRNSLLIWFPRLQAAQQQALYLTAGGIFQNAILFCRSGGGGGGEVECREGAWPVLCLKEACTRALKNTCAVSDGGNEQAAVLHK